MDITEEVICLAGGTQITNHLGVPNDRLTGISGLRPGCEVKLFEHSRYCRSSADAEDNCNSQLCMTLTADTMALGGMAGKASGATITCAPEPALYNLLAPQAGWRRSMVDQVPGGGNTCPGSDVSEADCLAAAQSLLASGQVQGRSNLVAGSWGWVPPGCSIQTHTTTHGAYSGDYAAHYNRGNGNNDGGYTKVCEAPCQHLHNMDVRAGTFAHYGLDAPGAASDEECSARCTADAECTAWVRRPSDGHCWISRQAVVTFESDSDRTTGLRCN